MRFIGIDPATVTGFVALDENGEVLVAQSVTGGKSPKGGITTEVLVGLENLIFNLLQPGDEIVMEDTAFGTQNAITTGMIHGGIRTMIYRKGLIPNMVNPTATKKYVNVSGWKGEVGKKVRLSKDEKKPVIKAAVIEHFDWTHKSHDVIDAYIMARIALNLYWKREMLPIIDTKPYQIHVINAILAGTEV
jgi:crossover junction endodeoxyribonuclease RuvC